MQLIKADFSFDGYTWSGVAEIWITRRYYRKSFALWFPGKVQHSVCECFATMSVLLPGRLVRQPAHTFKFNDFYWAFLFANKENFEIAEKGFFGLGVSVYLDTQEVTLILPKEFTLAK